MAADRGTQRALEVPHRRAPEVVGDPVRRPGRLAGGQPRAPEVLDGLPVAMV